ncbi:MAG: hypothetical protein QGG98_06420 [Pseudomonadales bacterium]|jgi:hypothetical protein|nr:hypothetical protein [Pseudomonadales bacterium]MDP7359267.1 hypothetical protein [Pseudomonadales bacterium]|tara:strand:- start:815 stop:1255 length:441 start_codon:yes stop_codon:yes gene_type:complete
MDATNRYSGSCHCGNIQLEFTTKIPHSEIQPRICTCSFCSKHNAVYISDPKGDLAVSVENPLEISAYQHGTNTAGFIVCKQCGVFAVALSKINRKVHAVLNVRTMDGAAFVNAPQLFDYDGEAKEERLARRSRNWIGQVTLENFEI